MAKIFWISSILGMEMTAEMMQRCNVNFCWPLSINRTYSSQLIGCNVDDGAADTVIYDELMHRVIQEVHQVQGLNCDISSDALQ